MLQLVKLLQIEIHNSRAITILQKRHVFKLNKTKDLFMASIGKVAFNIDGLTIHFNVEHTYANTII
jgi:hypothetical protein